MNAITRSVAIRPEMPATRPEMSAIRPEMPATRPEMPEEGGENAMNRYEDMLNMPHHQSTRHPHMSMESRAAQFSPFAALTGYEEELEEFSRRTQMKRELADEEKQRINRGLSLLQKRLEQRGAAERYVEAVFTYFRPDLLKEGGEYVTERLQIRRFDLVEGTLILLNGEQIPIDDLIEVELL